MELYVVASECLLKKRVSAHLHLCSIKCEVLRCTEVMNEIQKTVPYLLPVRAREGIAYAKTDLVGYNLGTSVTV